MRRVDKRDLRDVPTCIRQIRPTGNRLAGFTRRQALAGVSALWLGGCGGGDGASPAPAGSVPAPAPTPTPTSTATAYGPEIVTVRQFYRPDHGSNFQPAFQAAIDAAAASGKLKIVNDFGPVVGEMWCTVRTQPASAGHVADGMYLAVQRSVHLDFQGAKFDLKGPDGGSRDQPFPSYHQPWRGGWLMVPRGIGFERLTVENVTVDGGFNGSYQTADASNLTDKGIWMGDTEVREVYVRNVELRNFAGEIYYAVGLGPDYQYVENCHFHGSAQCAWDPATVGKVRAVNLRAGRAYQSAEVLGGRSQIYEGCHFYDSGLGGAVFYGGPSPDFVHGTYPWWYPHWDGVSEKPSIEFRGTKFEGLQFLRLSCWARGEIETVDTGVWLDHQIGDVKDIDLRIKSIAHQRNGYGLMFGGPPTITTQVKGAKEGIYIRTPTNIRVQMECGRTDNAIANGLRLRCGVLFLGGIVDTASVSIALEGQARRAWELDANAAPSPSIPTIGTAGFATV